MWLAISPFSLLLPLAALAWYSRRWAVLVLLASLSAYVIRLNILNIPTTWFELALYIILIISFFKDNWIKEFKTNIAEYKSWFAPMLLWLISSIVGLFVASDLRLALGVWKGFIIDPLLLCLLVWVVAWKEVKSLGWWRDILFALMIGASATTLIAWVQTWFTGLDRLQSGYDSPNVLAMYLAPILVAGILWYLSSKGRQALSMTNKLLWLINIVILSAGVYLTNSYSAWISVIVSILLVLALIKFPYLAKYIGLAVLVISLLFPFVTVMGNLSLLPGHTNTTYNVTSGEVRQVMWQQALNFIKTKPMFGLGLGQWQPEFTKVATNNGWLSIKNPGLAIELFHSSLYPHNLWLTTWLSTGLLGIVALLWIAIKIIFSLTNKLIMIPAGVMFVQMLHGTVDTPVWKNDLAVLWWLAVAAIIYWQYYKLDELNSHD